MDESEGVVDSVATTTTTKTVPACEEETLGVNSEQEAEEPCGEGDESDIMVEVKGSDVFVDGVRGVDGDGDNSLKKAVDSEAKTENLNGEVDSMENVVQDDAEEVMEGKTETGVARDDVEMESAEEADVAKEVGDEDTEKGVKGVEPIPGIETGNEPESKSSQDQIVTENAVKDTSSKDAVKEAGVSSSENSQNSVNPAVVSQGVDKDCSGDPSFKDEALHDSVKDALVSPLENSQSSVDPAACQGVEKDCSGGEIVDNSPSQLTSGDAALVPREEGTSLKDEAMHDGVSSSEKGQDLVNPTVVEKADKDRSVHDSNKISDCPSEPKSEILREEDTGSKDKDLPDSVADARQSSLESRVNPTICQEINKDSSGHATDQISDDPTICQEIDKDSSGHATDEISDCPAEGVREGESGVVNEDEITHSKVESMENSGNNEEGQQVGTAIHDTVVAGSESRDEQSEGSVDPNCEVLDKAESDKGSEDHVPEAAPTPADNDVKDDSEVLPDLQPSTESGIDNTNHDDLESSSHAKDNNLEKGGAREMEVEGVLDSENRTSSIQCPAERCNADAMDIHEDKLDVTNATNLDSTKYSDDIQTDAMDIDENKLDATNLDSTNDSDNVVQTDSELSVKHTVVVPNDTNSATEGLDGHESEQKNDESADLVNKGDNQAGNEVMDDQIGVNSTFEFIDDRFWQEDEGRNAKSDDTPDMHDHDQTGVHEDMHLSSSSKDEDLKAEKAGVTLAEQSDTTPGNDIEICNQMSTQPTGNSKEEVVVMQQDFFLTPEEDHNQSDVMITVVEGAAEMENALLKTNEKQEEEESKEVLGVKQSEDMKTAKPANKDIYPGFLLPPEKPGKFTVSDLVWGKVRSHPWWPGQIFDPADASEKAVRYYKKGCFLVAYFGDRTFAWNDASVLKPFWSHFSQIEKQSNSETFQNAVRCTLDEASRRIELGLACACVPKSSYNKIACQVVENTGIREESSRRYGVDRSTGVKSFTPDKLLRFLRGTALSPTRGADPLDLVIAHAQLLAYSRFKGCGNLSEFLAGGELLENENDLVVNKAPSLKRKHNLKDVLNHPMKKERRMSEIMGGGGGLELDDSLADGSDRTKSVYAAKASNTTGVVAPNPPFKIGERILRAASHLKGGGDEAGVPSPRAVPTELPSTDELFSQLQSVARDPTGDHVFLNAFVHLILDLRYPKQSELHNSSTGRPGRKRKASQAAAAADGATEDFEFDDVNDSYWTDRIVQNYSEEQLLQNGESGREEYQVTPPPAFDSDKSHKVTRRAYNRKRYSIGNNNDMGVDEEVSEEAEKRKQEPAELILNFAEGHQLPTEMNLNKIFRRFGPLKELETEVHPECARARVVFKRGSDAEVACSSAGKFSIFGSMHVDYELNYTPVISVRPLLISIPQGHEEAI